MNEIHPVHFEKLTNKVDRLKFLLLFSVLVSLFTLFVIVLKLPEPTSYTSKAGTNTASFSLLPTQISLPPEFGFQVWVNAQNPVAFAHVEINFDKNLVALTQEPELINPMLSRVVKRTSKTDANKTGVVVFAVGLDPINKALAPTGAFQLAKLTFNTITTQSNLTTQLTFNQSALKLVNPDASVFTLTTTNSNLTLNPLVLPSPTPAPSPSPSVAPSPGQIGSCDAYCKSVSLTRGLCRQNAAQCGKSNEVYVAEGNKYCAASRRNDVCCCEK
ncbi:MAG: hypothetical protein UV61_C0003G0094 [Candidatus Gottesmanbacteria bacterium GW2011_GWB1_43_11]|uniref:Cohesin domain-containing protein n=1 Tax=Candidatus Gottesmanbacteria bacterium GW2011_GWB1_43_11 TaxID=1618446 RepID=A0A0G1EW44_9BACT|nr:MAG: hypothetical protein UV17_C0016G0035 [Candidatus Gottesmanbacteria bacterium GW2011_GWA1_42_26]KKS80978.1 MAG: hypothetical protein UV55_C0024G0002 [Candidatus Gottesmanbacteria bacterium GW2011_GWC1_43_10]KKS87241.1 MAG: hypothetical protein UV61_C0003G0094 [Candidatus Gottesmanbacteria bacterium GW2011_GWB1_43_11]OGG10623.1 MAG: hypothetical protein A2699_03415 [Candidatus Gottesmanbacteria bacterium RIFCSPHIGHO2_01_FULL_43_15]OGG25232.1 MAG: hypothetical protein A3A59_01865 [Candidat